MNTKGKPKENQRKETKGKRKEAKKKIKGKPKEIKGTPKGHQRGTKGKLKDATLWAPDTYVCRSLHYFGFMGASWQNPGSHWEPVGASGKFGEPPGRLLGGSWELLGALGSHWEPLAGFQFQGSSLNMLRNLCTALAT